MRCFLVSACREIEMAWDVESSEFVEMIFLLFVKFNVHSASCLVEYFLCGIQVISNLLFLKALV